MHRDVVRQVLFPDAENKSEKVINAERRFQFRNDCAMTFAGIGLQDELRDARSAFAAGTRPRCHAVIRGPKNATLQATYSRGGPGYVGRQQGSICHKPERSMNGGLATAVSIVVAADKAARQGVLFGDATAIENFRKEDMLVVDKTGTLRERKPAFERVVATNGFADDEVLRLAASLDQCCEHPLANTALMAEIKVGVATLKERAETLRAEGASVMYLALENKLAGLMALSDPIKANMSEALVGLKAFGPRVVMANGIDAAMNSGQVPLVKVDLRGMPARELFDVTIANMKQNLCFAFICNSLDVSKAASVLYVLTEWLLSPMIAALAMSLSWASVITNALRLRLRLRDARGDA